MLLIELKRFIYSKKLVFVIITGLLIAVMNLVLANIYAYPSELMVMAFYQSYTQFSFMLLPAIVATTINTDLDNGYFAFFQQLGFGLNKYLTAKCMVYLLIPVLYTLLFTLFTLGAVKLSLILLIFLNVTLIVMISLLAAVIFTNKTYAVLMVFAILFAGDIINLIIPKPLSGLILLADKNSMSSAYAANLYQHKWDNLAIMPGEIMPFNLLVFLYLLAFAVIVFIIFALFKLRVKAL